MRHMKRSSVEPWRENFGETGCLEPAIKQNTNDDYEKIKWYSMIMSFVIII